MDSNITIERFAGAAVERHIAELARLRIEVFREFPYLYDGSMEYESAYLRTYVQSPDSVIVVAFDNGQAVGASTAVPLQHETDAVQRPFAEHGMDPRAVFYLGESVLLRHYRGRGIGVRFFEEREAHARSIGRFAWAAFCAVQRPAQHPRRPDGYVPLDRFWNNRGYRCHPELHTSFRWRDLDEEVASDKPMVFWLKALG